MFKQKKGNQEGKPTQQPLWVKMRWGLLQSVSLKHLLQAYQKA